jgi:gluconolactonase
VKLGAVSSLLWLACLGPAAGQDFSEIKVERVADKLLFAEGPVWAPEGFLLFCDVPGNRIMKFAGGGASAAFRENSKGTQGLAFDSQGRLYACESHARRVTRTDKKGKIEVLAERFEARRLNAPNDIAVRHDNQVYFSDPAFGKQMDSRELSFFGVYHVTPKGELEVIARPKGRPNGVALSPNGKTLYVANSDEKRIYRYDLDRSGAASNERVLISGIEGVPDGLKTDEKGNLYIAAKAVLIYTPEGKLIREVPVPEKPSNLAFGDADLESLYVTARTSVFRFRVPVKGWSIERTPERPPDSR